MSLSSRVHPWPSGWRRASTVQSPGLLRSTWQHGLLGRGFDWAYRKQWPLQWRLSCLAGVGVHQKKRCRKQLGSGRSHIARASSPITELLVDADRGSIELVKHAISRLKDMGSTVRTQVFAEPRRVEIRRWKDFLRDPDITFRPVPRSKDHSREPNDEAIESTLEKLSMRRGVHRIALLTEDADFLDI